MRSLSEGTQWEPPGRGISEKPSGRGLSENPEGGDSVRTLREGTQREP